MDNNIDILNESCTSVTPECLLGAERIVILTSEEDLPQWLTEHKLEFWKIPDYPGVPTKEETYETLRLIKEKMLEII